MMLRMAFAVVCALALFAVDASAQWRGRGYSGITVYEDPDFRGDSVSFRDEIPDLRGHGLNDRITSLDVDGNQAWEVCQDVHFGGRCRVFSGSVEDLRDAGWNDRISSLRPVGYARGSAQGPWWGGQSSRNRGNQSRLMFYDRPNYRGNAREVVNSSNNLGSLGDRARSVQVIGYGSWELCDGSSRNARCVTINDSVPDLRRLGLQNGVISIRETAVRPVAAGGNGDRRRSSLSGAHRKTYRTHESQGVAVPHGPWLHLVVEHQVPVAQLVFEMHVFGSAA